MATQRTLVTAEDLLRPPYSSIRCELVDGEVIEMTPTGESHGVVSLALGEAIRAHVRSRKLGRAYGAETGFRLSRNPDTVLAPDVAFVAAQRLPTGRPSRAFLQIAPDLVVEVVSPSDSAAEIQRRVEQWLDAGLRLVWVAYPDTESIAVFPVGSTFARLKIDDTLDGSDVLPGFSVPLRELFEPW